MKESYDWWKEIYNNVYYIYIIGGFNKMEIIFLKEIQIRIDKIYAKWFSLTEST